MPLHPGHMGVAEERDPVGIQLERLAHRTATTCLGLVRQAVHEVEIDRLDAAQRAATRDAGAVPAKDCRRPIDLAPYRIEDPARPGSPGWTPAAARDSDVRPE